MHIYIASHTFHTYIHTNTYIQIRSKGIKTLKWNIYLYTCQHKILAAVLKWSLNATQIQSMDFCFLQERQMANLVLWNMFANTDQTPKNLIQMSEGRSNRKPTWDGIPSCHPDIIQGNTWPGVHWFKLHASWTAPQRIHSHSIQRSAGDTTFM